MFNELFERLVLLNESREGIMALYRVYRDVEQNQDPDSIDVAKALRMMQEYYESYMDWYRERPKIGRQEMPVFKAYQMRLAEIKSALVSGNEGDRLVALDTAINQWHVDYPAIAHLEMMYGDEDEKLSKLVSDTITILDKLGRLPKDSPYMGCD